MASALGTHADGCQHADLHWTQICERSICRQVVNVVSRDVNIKCQMPRWSLLGPRSSSSKFDFGDRFDIIMLLFLL